jgi:hypothetical protein
MQSLLIFHPDQSLFQVSDLQQIAITTPGFHSIRFSSPGGSTFEAEYSQLGDYTTLRLNEDRTVISISGETDAPLQAVLLLQNYLAGPLRIVGTDYSFDFILHGFRNIDELRSTMLDGLNSTGR